jgi:DNA-binding Lrp family transcriptional regulator
LLPVSLKKFIKDFKLKAKGEVLSIAFVLVSTVPGKEHEVFNKISKINYVVELHPLFGEYDLIVKIDAKDYTELGKIVINQIRTIDGVIDTKTLTGIKF